MSRAPARAVAVARKAHSPRTTRPTPTDVLPRARLFRLLDQARRPIAWVAGPPGSGKTVLVASYLRARHLRALWYQVNEDDTDVATLFYELRRAFAGAAGPRRKALPLLRPEHQPTLPSFARQYFQEVYGRLRPPFVLVLDDYQDVSPESPFHDVIRCALGELPAGGSAIIISRVHPPRQLARLRASRAIGLVQWKDLRLTVGETEGIARLRGSAPLSRRTLRELYRKTGGWAAGVILQLERASREPALSSAVLTQTSEEVFDYFAGEIFAAEPASTQTFLLETAFLSRTTARMAERLTGSPRAADILSALSRRNYFTERRADREPVYRYHPLFREFLVGRARVVLPPGRLADLQRRAARLLTEHGRGAEATDLLREVGDWEALAQLIANQAASLAAQGRTRTLETWLGYLPRRRLAGHPWLQYWLGICRLPADPDASRDLFEQAFQVFDDRDDPAGLVHAWCGVVESVLYEWSDFRKLDPWLGRLDRVWRAARSLRDPEVEARVAFGAFGALMFRQPQHADIVSWAERALALAGRSRDISQRVMACSHLAHYFYWMGDLRRAQAIIDSVSRAPQLREAAPVTRLNWTMTEAIAHWHRDETEQCVEKVSKGLKEAHATGVHLWDCALAAQGVYGTLSAGRLADGDAYLQRMSSLLRGTRLLDVSHFHYLSAWQAALQRDLESARRHAQTAVDLGGQAGTPFPLALGSLSLADVTWEQGDRTASRECLDRARTIARDMRSLMLQFIALLLEARCAFARGEEDEGARSLRHAMRIGRTQGIVNTPWWQASQMAVLCARALEAGIETDYVRALVRRRGLVPETPPLEVDAWPWPIKVLTLQPFRVERNDTPLRFGRKIQQKPLALLKALVAFGARDVREDQIVDALWPDAEGDAAHRAFAITLHRARQLLGLDGAIVRQGARLSLGPQVCWVDVWAFEGLLDRADAAARGGRPEETRRLLERAAALYRQPFLADQPDDLPWAAPLRERLRGRFIRAVGTLGRSCQESGRSQEAVAWYEKGVDAEPLADDLHGDLMTTHLQAGHEGEAFAAYQRYRRALAAQGLAPSSRIEAIRGSIP